MVIKIGTQQSEKRKTTKEIVLATCLSRFARPADTWLFLSLPCRLRILDDLCLTFITVTTPDMTIAKRQTTTPAVFTRIKNSLYLKPKASRMGITGDTIHMKTKRFLSFEEVILNLRPKGLAIAQQRSMLSRAKIRREAVVEYRPIAIKIEPDIVDEHCGTEPRTRDKIIIGISIAVTSKSAIARLQINAPQIVFRLGVRLITRTTTTLPKDPPTATTLQITKAKTMSVVFSEKLWQYVATSLLLEVFKARFSLPRIPEVEFILQKRTVLLSFKTIFRDYYGKNRI